ncbi:hypothetical protein CPAV1605_1280 [seawater metagenome]|uniref:FAD-binding FR-type domain-containing protein n=1 Tax=seawater metagenome TaxID=1561972 RepID=A0A5E8CL40_9ZZZZ
MDSKVPLIKAKVISNSFIAPGSFILEVEIKKSYNIFISNDFFCYYCNISPILRNIPYRPYCPFEIIKNDDNIFLKFVIKIRGKLGMSYFLSKLIKNDELFLSEPLEDFRISYKNDSLKLLMIGYSTGIAPFLQIINNIKKNKYRIIIDEITLIIGNKNMQNAILLSYLNELISELKYKINFKLINRFDLKDKYSLNQDFLEGVPVYLKHKVEVICTGSPDFLKMIIKTLQKYENLILNL